MLKCPATSPGKLNTAEDWNRHTGSFKATQKQTFTWCYHEPPLVILQSCNRTYDSFDNQFAWLYCAGTKPAVAQDKPIGMMREERPSVSFADGDSLLMTAFIVQNSSLRNVRDSVILPKCYKTKPKSSPTPKGILGKFGWIGFIKPMICHGVDVSSFPLKMEFESLARDRNRTQAVFFSFKESYSV